jgi:prepilin-type N-terminal cleavage/methylation domain-containing protein
MMSSFRNTNGFTLIELMVVVIIIGVLAAVAVPMYTRTIKNSRTTEATARLSAIMKASKLYYLQHGSWPRKNSLGFLADFSTSEHFKYKIQNGAGGRKKFTLRAIGLNIDGMKNVRITMICQDVESESEIVIDKL